MCTAPCSSPLPIPTELCRLSLVIQPPRLSARQRHGREDRRREHGLSCLQPNKAKASLCRLEGFVRESQEVGCLRFEFAIYFISIRVIVGESGVDLSQVDMRILICNLLGSEPLLIARYDLVDGHPATVNSNAATTDISRTAQESIDCSAHDLAPFYPNTDQCCWPPATDAVSHHIRLG